MGQKFRENSTGGFSDFTENKRDYKPLFITWSLMGLWHGANWTFVVWGIYHAILIFIYRTIKSLGKNINFKLKNLIGLVFTLSFVMLSWVPFRSQNLSDCFQMWFKVINPFEYSYLGLRENIYLITFLLFLGVLLSYVLKKKIILKKLFPKIVVLLSDLFLIVFLFCLTFIFLRPINQFIYFQF